MFNINFEKYIYEKINIYYLSSNSSKNEDFLTLLEEKKILSKIEFVIDETPNDDNADVNDVEGEIMITSIYTQKEFRNKGFAKFLLKEVIKNSNVKRIKLDSMLNTIQNNLFIECGFKFVDYGNGPEMILNI